MDKVKWGIIGTGQIARRWINGAMQVKEMEIAAVAGRTREKVDLFCDQYDIKNRYYTYEELINDNEIDCIYVATPHTAHKEHAMLAMKHGKHVLVEKPIAVSEKDALAMINCAKEHNVLLMEAMWTRFFPLIHTLKEILNDERIGKVRSVHAAFSFRAPADKNSRLFDPKQAGGGLLDVGVYPLHFADIVYDCEPLDTCGYAAIGTDEHNLEVDEQASFISTYDNGALAVMSCGVRTTIPDTAVIYTTDAMITIPRFWSPTALKIQYFGNETKQIDCKVDSPHPDYVDEGFQYEIRHMCDCIMADIKESPVMTYKKSLSVMRQCDKLRKQWRLTYPFEI